jgi:hypothetical protein
MTSILEEYSSILDKLGNEIDISPTDYQRAVESYNSVGKWLSDGFLEKQYPFCLNAPDIYPQGSFNLGTVVRPIREGKESDFDIDLVCESIYSASALPSRVKQNIGNRLQAHDIYREKMSPEGRRCWTLLYAPSDKLPFHMDILPCKSNGGDGEVAITDLSKNTHEYSWRSSNPRGFAKWFKSCNTTTAVFSQSQKQRFLETAMDESGKALYDSIEAVPDILVRTPLQRMVQLLKRHRDIQFAASPENKPISMIITTLSAKVYSGETSTAEALFNAIEALYSYSEYLGDKKGAWILSEQMKKQSLITRRWNAEGYWEWYIPNPINQQENFADKWHENNNVKAKAFFEWIEVLHREFQEIKQPKGIHKLYESMANAYGSDAAKRVIKSYGEEVFSLRNEGKLFFAAGTGTLGADGTQKVKDHTFYGENDSKDLY